jgi:hypothetical protein
MTTLLTPEITTVDELEERCDRCGAAAKLSVTLATGGELAFCGHHANRLRDDIVRIGERIVLVDGFDWAGNEWADN